jgi:hypothetical protein
VVDLHPAREVADGGADLRKAHVMRASNRREDVDLDEIAEREAMVKTIVRLDHA